MIVTVNALNESRAITISIHEGRYYHEPVTKADMRLYKTSNNFVVKSYK